MKNKFLTSILAGTMAFAACGPILPVSEAEIQRNPKQVVIYTAGSTMLHDIDGDGKVDMIRDNDKGAENRVKFIAKGYELKFPIDSEYTKPMSEEIRTAASNVYKDLNALSYEVAKFEGRLSTPTAGSAEYNSRLGMKPVRQPKIEIEPEKSVSFSYFPTEKKFPITFERYCGLRKKDISKYDVLGVDSETSIERPSKIEAIVDISCTENLCRGLALLPKLDKSKIELEAGK